MATVTLLEKARQRRLNALASLGTAKRTREKDGFSSIFDYAFDEQADDLELTVRNNVVAFRSGRNDKVAARNTAEAERIAA